MKKVNFTLLILMVSILASFAQMPYKNSTVKNEPMVSKVSKGLMEKAALLKKQKESQKGKASSSSYWVNYGDALSADAAYSGITDFSNSANTLGGWPIWPDSNAVIVSSAALYTPFNWYSHAYCDVFSPASSYIAKYAKSTLNIPNGDLFFNRNNSYHVDSIRFLFGYYQRIQANDSLYVYVINPTSPAFGDYNFQSDTSKHFRLADYSYTKNAPMGSGITTYGYALTAADSSGLITIPVNINVAAATNANGRFSPSIGVAFRYKPNQPYVLGDTLNNYGTNTAIHKRLNGCNLLCYEETSGADITSNSSDFSYNLGSFANTEIRYNMAGGWNGVYITTLAYSAGFFPEHAYIDYHLNYEGAAFTYTKAITTFKFTDISNFTPTSWSWDFGDGIGSDNVKTPTYTYTTNGTYTVCLTASSASKSYTSCRIVKVTNVGVDNVSEFTLGNVYPNPVTIGTMLNIPVDLNGTSNQAIVKVYNTVGAVVAESNQTVNENVTVSTENLTAGMYMFSVEINGQKTTGKFSVVK
jgi:PKD repeat protein